MKMTLKRLLLIALSIVMVLSLCCCKKNPDENLSEGTTIIIGGQDEDGNIYYEDEQGNVYFEDEEGNFFYEDESGENVYVEDVIVSEDGSFDPPSNDSDSDSDDDGWSIGDIFDWGNDDSESESDKGSSKPSGSSSNKPSGSSSNKPSGSSSNKPSGSSSNKPSGSSSNKPSGSSSNKPSGSSSNKPSGSSSSKPSSSASSKPSSSASSKPSSSASSKPSSSASSKPSSSSGGGSTTTTVNKKGSSTNTYSGKTMTITYDWHPGLPNADVKYSLTVKVNGSVVNASTLTYTPVTSGVTVSGNNVTIPYSARSAGKDACLKVTHTSGAYCDVAIPTKSWTQTFNDDFTGTQLDRTKWKEHANYTTTAPSDAASYQVVDRAKGTANSCKVENGKLKMLIQKIPCYDVANKIKYLYSECCLSTQGMFMQKYGLFEARLSSAPFSGINTAFWLLPNGAYGTKFSHFKTSNPQKGLAEIDIIESSVAWGSSRNRFAITEHYYDYKNNYTHTQASKYFDIAGGTITDFHNYSCAVLEDALYYYLDGNLIRTVTDLQATSAGGESVQRLYMIVDVALYLDNEWVGKRDFKASDLPISGQVEWARAYK